MHKMEMALIFKHYKVQCSQQATLDVI